METNATVVGAEVTRFLRAEGSPPEPVAMRVVTMTDTGVEITVADTPYVPVRLGDRMLVTVIYAGG